ncbi:TPA: hypothetical protein SAN82_003353 [Pseudomonas putida]|nr:hypothetical protein [Pseudomonas putida]
MPITTFNGEKNLSELSDKLFVRLTPLQREKVGAALLKANPQLGELSSVPPGAILKVPDLPELSAKTRGAPDNPNVQMMGRLRSELDSYDKRLGARNEEANVAIAHTKQLLADPMLTRVIGRDPTLRQLLEGIGKANEAREGELAQQQKEFGVALEQLLKDLDNLGARKG